jgi:hypothetical protein
LGEAAGGESGGHTAGAAGNSDEPEAVTDVPLASGTCGIRRRIGEPGGPRALDDSPVRQAGGFSLGPTASGSSEAAIQAYFFKDDERRWRQLRASGSNNDVHWSFMLATGPKLAEVFVGPATPDGEDFSVRIWEDGAQTPSQPGILLRSSWRGTDAVLVRPSLDGEHAVFAIWAYALLEPRAAVIGPDGARVGEALSLAPPDHRSTDCEQITPTAHGGAVSFVDVQDKTWRLFELGRSTRGAIDVTLPWPDVVSGCPRVVADDTGVSILVQDADGEPEYHLFHANGPGAPSETSLVRLGEAMAFTTTERGPLVLELVNGKHVLGLFAAEGTQSFELEDLNVMQVIPSEQGAIFLDHMKSDGSREIVELGCD